MYIHTNQLNHRCKEQVKLTWYPSGFATGTMMNSIFFSSCIYVVREPPTIQNTTVFRVCVKVQCTVHKGFRYCLLAIPLCWQSQDWQSVLQCTCKLVH